MSYSVYCDSYPLLLFDHEDYRIFSTKLIVEDNKAGSFQFTIYPTHPNYTAIERLKSVISVYNDSTLVFKGRVLNDDLGWENQRTVFCEGWLAILNDSVQRPFRFPVDADYTTPGAYFEFLIGRHNAQMPADKQLTVGTVTVTDANDYIARSDSEYSTTWSLIKSGLLDTVGGHLVMRYENGVNYIDYLATYVNLSTQPIVFGENLLDILTTRRGEDIATAILPLGAQDEETKQRLTISSLDDTTSTDICKSGDIVYSIAAETAYGGRIVKTVVWDKVTVPLNLLRKAQAELEIRRAVQSEQKLTAADMSAAGYNVEPWMAGKYVYVTDEAHNAAHDLQPYYLINKVSIDLLNPTRNTVSVGSVSSSFSEQSKNQIKQAVGDLTVIVDQHIEESLVDVNESIEDVNNSIDTINESISDVNSSLTDVSNSVDSLNDNVAQNLSDISQSIARLDGLYTVANDNATAAYTYAQNVESSVADILAYIKTGLLYYDANNQPQFGVEIAQQSISTSFKSRFTSDMLGFYEGDALISFFKNRKLNVETGRFSKLEMSSDLTNAASTDWEITLSNGFTIRWVGS